MKRLSGLFAGIAGSKWLSFSLLVGVGIMLSVVVQQIFAAGRDAGVARTEKTVTALRADLKACRESNAAYGASLAMQNRLSQEIAQTGETLRAETRDAAREAAEARKQSQALRERLQRAGAMPAGTDVAVDKLNMEAWRAVQCARTGCPS